MLTHNKMRVIALAVLFASFLFISSAIADPAAMPNIATPKIPDRVFKLSDYGAAPDGKTSNTRAFAAAIKACEAAGGGKVVVPPGDYLTGPIVLVSNLELHLEEGALLRFSDDPAEYPVGGFAPLPERHQSLITITNGHDVAITGKGKVDGQGAKWWAAIATTRKQPGFIERRPKGIVFDQSKRCRVEGVTLFNFPMFHMSPTQAEDITIEGVTVTAPAESPNTDSCNPSGWNIWVNNCHFDTGDDNIAVKPFIRAADGRASVENLWITNCVFKNGHGLSVGGQTPGGLKNMHVRNIIFEGTDIGIRLKAERGFGGVVEDVTYENITMKNVKQAIVITSYYHGLPKPGEKHAEKEADNLTPVWKNIQIKNLTATGSDTAGLLMGLPEMPIEGVIMENVSIQAKQPMRIGYAHGLNFLNNVKIEVPGGNPFLIEQDVQGQGLPTK